MIGPGMGNPLPNSIELLKGSNMSRAAVFQFCQQISKTPELRTRLESGVKAGAGWDLLVSVGHEHGFDFTAHEAAECFEHERQRRAGRESAGHSETHILKQSPVMDTRMAETLIMSGGNLDSDHTPSRAAEMLSLNGLRRVALSHDWSIELSNSATDEDESIFS